ncbi:APC family permease [Moheibacter lacus]|uniref:Amino acid permease n=1 Tax=Moheibacter lacus TaxID=2745851 RepID=A0A838ZIA2_9FLAO|nr:amino acid permease [Moheibacter lacus]MBA5628968.1 amino acid permease [Moheibacter lacus]
MRNKLFRKKSIEKLIQENQETSNPLKKVLTVKDLTFMGIAAVVGAGIFSTIGSAAYNGGPGISLLFIITAVTCGFTALCYAEFASRIPVSGSAYTYSYVAFGELAAWIIGWALILEYSIGNIVVAISWSSYFNNLLVHLFNIHLPDWMLIDPATAKNAFIESTTALSSGADLTAKKIESYQFAINAYNAAPTIGDTKIFFNLPAFIIVALVTWLAYIGIKESKKSANFMVYFKVAVILFVIVAGAFFVDTNNWRPFLPNGFEGVLKGVSAVFYAYIGFDAISTMAEETKNPQRDMPRGMIYSLLICTGLYILIALTLTGIEHYSHFNNVSDPLAFVFEDRAPWIEKIVSISAVVATTSVLLVFQIGQPRIWMSMSRDGLLPKKFGQIHPKYQTPAFSTIVTGIIVGIGSLFIESDLVTDLTSIGTLFAFILVSGGVLFLPPKIKEPGKFKLPYINGKWIIPILYLIFIYTFQDRIINAFTGFHLENTVEVLFMVFLIFAALISILTFIRNYSFIPIMGVLMCAYMMIEIPLVSWKWFMVWMIVGLLIYFLYGFRNSKLSKEALDYN